MKKLMGVVGFALLFCTPADASWKSIGIWAGCLAVAVSLLAFAGAFGRQTSKTSRV